MSTSFPADVVRKAWVRQGGRCAYCGKRLNSRSGWDTHHRKPDYLDGTETLRNCVIFCNHSPNCHFNVGHGGVSWMHYEPLNDAELPYLYYGRSAQRRIKKRITRRC